MGEKGEPLSVGSFPRWCEILFRTLESSQSAATCVSEEARNFSREVVYLWHFNTHPYLRKSFKKQKQNKYVHFNHVLPDEDM